MNEICGDNRFEIIAKAKADLLEGTNIETDEAEMAVLDNILFRCWQMGWLDRYDDRKTESSSDSPNNCEDEPQYDAEEVAKDINRRVEMVKKEWHARHIEDEPQTDYTPDCPFCKRYGTEDCLGSDCRHYKTYKTEPQTERSE